MIKKKREGGDENREVIRAGHFRPCGSWYEFWPFFLKKKKIYIYIYIYKLYLFTLVASHGMEDLSSLTRDQTCAPCSGNMES